MAMEQSGCKDAQLAAALLSASLAILLLSVAGSLLVYTRYARRAFHSPKTAADTATLLREFAIDEEEESNSGSEAAGTELGDGSMHEDGAEHL